MSISLIELCESKTKLELRHYGIYPFTSKKKIIKTLKKFLAQYTLRTRQVHLALSSLQIMKKTVQFNADLTDQDILLELSEHPPQYFPDIDVSVNIDFIRRKETQLFAVKRTDIIRQQKIFENVKLKVISIEPDNHVLLRTLLFAHVKPQKKGALFLYHDEMVWRVLIFNHQQILHDQRFLTSSDDHLISKIWQDVNCQPFCDQIETIYVCDAKLLKWASQRFPPIVQINPFDALSPHLTLLEKNQLLIALGLALRGVYVHD